jgi:hypothetical protein
MQNEIDSDPDLTSTILINTLAILRADACAALAARDAIDNFLSKEWADAHASLLLACALADAEMRRLADNPKTRYGDWRTDADVELMALGLL